MMTVIDEARTNTKRFVDGKWIYGPFQSTKALRQWVITQFRTKCHADPLPSGQSIIKVGKLKIGETTRSSDGLIYLKSDNDSLKAPPDVAHSKVQPAAAEEPKAPPEPVKEPEAPQQAPEDPQALDNWAAQSNELRSVNSEINNLHAKIRATFSFMPETDTDTDEYVDFLQRLYSQPGRTSRQRMIISNYIDELLKLDAREDELSSTISGLEDKIGGSGFEGVQTAFDTASKSPDVKINTRHKNMFSRKLDRALSTTIPNEPEEKVVRTPQRGDTVRLPNGRTAEVATIRGNAMTLLFGGDRLETIGLDSDYEII